MVAPPGTLKTDSQIVGYYHDVARALGDGVPIVLQDFPLATNVHVAPEVIGRIVADIPEMVMLKHEDWPGLAENHRNPKGGKPRTAPDFHFVRQWRKSFCPRNWRAAPMAQ